MQFENSELGQNGLILRTLGYLQNPQFVGDHMLHSSKYNIGDEVLISKKLSTQGRWEDIPTQVAKILDVRETISLGPAYTLEINGARCNICYWESDIDGLLVMGL